MRNLVFYQQRRYFISAVGVIGFPLYWFVWTYLYPQPYENVGLRFLGTVLFASLLIPAKYLGAWRCLNGLRWYGTLLYGLPFFFTFMMFKNGGNSPWMESLLVAIFVMVLLLDAVMLVLFFCVGTTLAWVAYASTTVDPYSYLLFGQQAWIIGFAMAIGTAANFANERVRAGQERAMLGTARSIAHELRTPLLSIKAGSGGLKQHLPALLDAYARAKQAGLPVTPIRGAHFEALKGVLDRIEREADYSNAVIDTMMANARGAGEHVNAGVRCQIRRCIDLALERYPFSSSERDLVSVSGNDFRCCGEELLLVHVLFNLIKNSLRHIAQARRGSISISLSTTARWNLLVFRDTGPGISAADLPHIFERFFSGSKGSGVMGTGIGLAFCRDVLRAYGGTIECRSELDGWTEFTLYFPKVEQ